MKNFLLFSLALTLAIAVNAQSLQYSQAKIITNSVETVPAGKVWKITAVYGSEFRVQECVDFRTTSTHEIGTRVRCAYDANYSRIFTYRIGTFKLNGANIVSSISGFSDGTLGVRYSDVNCTTPLSSSSSTFTWSCINQDADPNILPIWVPAGSTLESGGPNTFISVIEFTEVP